MKKITIALSLVLSLTCLVPLSSSFAATDVKTATSKVTNIPIQVSPTNPQVIGIIKESNVSIPVTSTSSSFYQVNYNDINGYINKAYTVEGAKEIESENQTTGNQTTGNQTTGNQTTGNQTTGNSLKYYMEKCKAYYRDNKFVYGYYGNIPAKLSNKQTDCSTYVSWVLYEYGKANNIKALTSKFKSKVRSYHFNPMGKDLAKGKKNAYFTLVKGIENAKLGDILCYNGHVEFYAGSVSNGKARVYNCGATSYIRSSNLVGTASRNVSKITYILRLRDDLK